MDAAALDFIGACLLSGKLVVPTPFEELERDCHAVWQRALRVFGGDKNAARRWLETRSPAFDGRRPLAVAMQVGGRRKVLREMASLARSLATEATPANCANR